MSKELAASEIDELTEQLQCTEDWAPKTHHLVSRMLDENAALRATIQQLETRVKEVEDQFAEYKRAQRNITVEEMGYTLREVEALGIDFDKEVVSDGNALHDVTMKRIRELRQLEAKLAELQGEA